MLNSEFCSPINFGGILNASGRSFATSYARRISHFHRQHMARTPARTRNENDSSLLTLTVGLALPIMRPLVCNQFSLHNICGLCAFHFLDSARPIWNPRVFGNETGEKEERAKLYGL